MQSAPRALIAGLGLIGGSIGIALRRAGWRVAFVDPNVTLEQARAAGAADEAGGEADLVVLATPLDVAEQFLRTQDSGVRTITSVCSVMQPLRAAAGKRDFVAGHPLAGSEQSGLAAARGDLFRDKTWFVDREHALVARMVRDCGARLERVAAEEHDSAVALTSALPQILSTALAAYLEEHGFDDRFAGSGLRTFLRLAGSDPSVWMPIISANRASIAPHAERVQEIVRSILAGDPSAFDRARRVWARLLSSRPQ
jgi:prephenate dehydrogenase